ncbi:major capsid protein [Nonomuraea sp. NPDC000554]|uniref:major capsid protein n=1 Tax=Nonomuraea sp. NPDC000554 TaxID=3154259 RepID=UPI00331D533C
MDVDGDLVDRANMACPEMLWDLPEVQLARGGLRFFPMPSLDVGSMTWIHTEADDISGAQKPCFKIPCPEPQEVRCDAVGICLEAGILTQRHFPELVAHYQRLAMVAHEIRIRQELFNQAVAQSTSVTIAATFGAFSALFAAVALQAADMTERRRHLRHRRRPSAACHIGHRERRRPQVPRSDRQPGRRGRLLPEGLGLRDLGL